MFHVTRTSFSMTTSKKTCWQGSSITTDSDLSGKDTPLCVNDTPNLQGTVNLQGTFTIMCVKRTIGVREPQINGV